MLLAKYPPEWLWLLNKFAFPAPSAASPKASVRPLAEVSENTFLVGPVSCAISNVVIRQRPKSDISRPVPSHGDVSVAAPGAADGPRRQSEGARRPTQSENRWSDAVIHKAKELRCERQRD